MAYTTATMIATTSNTATTLIPTTPELPLNAPMDPVVGVVAAASAHETPAACIAPTTSLPFSAGTRSMSQASRELSDPVHLAELI